MRFATSSLDLCSITYRRNLPGQINILGQAHLALVEGALKVSLLNRVAAICVLVDERDESVLDLEVHLEAFADFLLEVAGSLDAELLATAQELAFELNNCDKSGK